MGSPPDVKALYAASERATLAPDTLEGRLVVEKIPYAIVRCAFFD
jgi:hypothetical protein